MSYLVGNSLLPTHVGTSHHQFDVTRFVCHSSFVSTLQLQCLLRLYYQFVLNKDLSVHSHEFINAIKTPITEVRGQFGTRAHPNL